jgi:gliding motility-associated-like protein
LKIVAIVLGILLFCFCSEAQDAFIRTSGHYYYKNNLKIQPTPDLGWVLYEPDSFKIFKYNACGRIEWVRRYQLPVSGYQGLDCFITTRTGGYAFFNMVPEFNLTKSQLTVVDGNGDVLWSRIFSDLEFSITTYSIGQDKQGSFFIYANASKIGGGDVFIMLTKLSESGDQQWTRFYNRGGFWGGAIATDDKGFLMRTGSNVIKADSSGLFEWGTVILSGSGNYITPLEVEDGYILTGLTPNFLQTAYYKLKKDGTPAFSGCMALDQPITGIGVAPFLRRINIGRVGGMFSIGNRPTFVYFDHSMNVVNTHSLTIDPMVMIQGIDIAYSKDDRVLVAGTINIGDFAFFPQVFTGKSDSSFRFGCDTVLTVSTSPLPGSIQPFTVTSVLHTMQALQQTVLVENLTDETFLYCGSSPEPLSVQIEGDSVICNPANPVMLSLKSVTNFDSVLWSDGSDKTTLSVSKPGKYWVRTFDNCRKEVASDTMVVKEGDFPEIPWSQKFSLCDADGFMLKAEMPGATYRWQDGSTSSSFQASNPGVYSVNIMLDGCEKVLQTEIEDCEILDIPNLFTPDGNALNERFVSGKMKGIRNQHLEIFNRWGQKIHESNDFKTEGWDGKTSLPGIYFWSLNYTNFKGESKTKTGVIEKQ